MAGDAAVTENAAATAPAKKTAAAIRPIFFAGDMGLSVIEVVIRVSTQLSRYFYCMETPLS